MKSFGKRFSIKSELKNVKNDFGIIKAWQKIAQTSNKKSVKSSLIYKNIN